MSMQNQRIFSASITTGNSTCSAIDTGGGYLYISIEVPASGAVAAFSASGGSPVYILGSSDNSNFRRYYEIYTNTVANAFNIASSVSNAIVPLNAINTRYLKLEISGTVTGAGGPVLYKVICTDSL